MIGEGRMIGEGWMIGDGLMFGDGTTVGPLGGSIRTGNLLKVVGRGCQMGIDTITDKTKIPLFLAISTFVVVCGAVGGGAWWVATLTTTNNMRLSAIEMTMNRMEQRADRVDEAEARIRALELTVAGLADIQRKQVITREWALQLYSQNPQLIVPNPSNLDQSFGREPTKP